MVLHGQYKALPGSDSDICIAPKTMAIVMKQKKTSDSTFKRYTGERLFTLFRRANSGCSWNQQMYQAIRKIVFVGYLRPHTLLVYGTSDHIEALRSSWVKNILVAPDGFSLIYFGELQPLCIDTVSTTSFTPLPDALCSIILQLNRLNADATITTIKQRLEKLYSHIQPPTDQVVFETLNNLMREKKLCLTDTGYFISSSSHTEPLSVVIGNPSHNALHSPTKLKNTHHSGRQKISSPKKSNKTGRDTRQLAGVQGELPKKKTDWCSEQDAESKKSKVKDKGGALRRIFGIKPKPNKKRNQSGESAGTSSGCSSAHSPPLPLDDDDGVVVDNNIYSLDTRSASQLTSAMVPFQMTNVPDYRNRSMSDSMMVHCGATLMVGSNNGSDYESDWEAEVEDRVPEMYHRPMRHHRHRATTHLMKRPNGQRRRRLNSSETTDTESCLLSSQDSNFERKKYNTMTYRHSSTRQRSNRPQTTVPDVSSIMAVTSRIDSTITPFGSMPVPDTTTLAEDEARPGVEGASDDVAHHSTPKEDDSLAYAKSKVAFNATGHTQCHGCCRDMSDTPKRVTSVSTFRRYTVNKTDDFQCECQTITACSCIIDDQKPDQAGSHGVIL